MLMSPDQEALIGRVFDSYLTEHHQKDIVQILEDTNEETHRPVVVNAMTLFEANMEVMSAQYKTQSTGFKIYASIQCTLFNLSQMILLKSV